MVKNLHEDLRAYCPNIYILCPKAVGEPVPIRNSVSYRPSSDLDFGASDSDPFDP